MPHKGYKQPLEYLAKRYPYSPVERFWRRVDKQEDRCWVWQGAQTGRGYAQFWDGHHYIYVHRYAYECLIGPILEGLTIDHLCRNRACVNPAHLEAVDLRTNILRGEGVAAHNARKSHCIHGHPWDMLNTYFYPNGERGCRECQRIWGRLHGRKGRIPA